MRWDDCEAVVTPRSILHTRLPFMSYVVAPLADPDPVLLGRRDATEGLEPTLALPGRGSP